MSEGSKWQLRNKQNDSFPFKNLVFTDADLASLKAVLSRGRTV
jgi:hypothetical protein